MTASIDTMDGQGEASRRPVPFVRTGGVESTRGAQAWSTEVAFFRSRASLSV